MTAPLPAPGSVMIDGDGDIYEIQGPREPGKVKFVLTHGPLEIEGIEAAADWHARVREYAIRFMTPREVATFGRNRQAGKALLDATRARKVARCGDMERRVSACGGLTLTGRSKSTTAGARS